MLVQSQGVASVSHTRVEKKGVSEFFVRRVRVQERGLADSRVFLRNFENVAILPNHNLTFHSLCRLLQPAVAAGYGERSLYRMVSPPLDAVHFC